MVEVGSLIDAPLGCAQFSMDKLLYKPLMYHELVDVCAELRTLDDPVSAQETQPVPRFTVSLPITMPLAFLVLTTMQSGPVAPPNCNLLVLLQYPFRVRYEYFCAQLKQRESLHCDPSGSVIGKIHQWFTQRKGSSQLENYENPPSLHECISWRDVVDHTEHSSCGERFDKCLSQAFIALSVLQHLLHTENSSGCCDAFYLPRLYSPSYLFSLFNPHVIKMLQSACNISDEANSILAVQRKRMVRLSLVFFNLLHGNDIIY